MKEYGDILLTIKLGQKIKKNEGNPIVNPIQTKIRQLYPIWSNVVKSILTSDLNCGSLYNLGPGFSQTQSNTAHVHPYTQNPSFLMWMRVVLVTQECMRLVESLEITVANQS